jgi:hypothetical protein
MKIIDITPDMVWRSQKRKGPIKKDNVPSLLTDLFEGTDRK